MVEIYLDTSTTSIPLVVLLDGTRNDQRSRASGPVVSPGVTTVVSRSSGLYGLRCGFIVVRSEPS